MKLFLKVLLAGLLVLPVSAQKTFMNPLLPSGADPFVAARDGYYYYMHTTSSNLVIWRTKDITDLAHAEKKIVWNPPATGPYSHWIWAPELYFLNGKWYIYFAADAGKNETHRNWVLENPSANPLEGEWTMKGQLTDGQDLFDIDPTILEDKGKLYVLWSRMENNVQGIYIASLKNPWTIKGKGVRVSAPYYAWEKVGDLKNDGKTLLEIPHIDVNEGPEILKHNGKIYLIISASGCWTNYYQLGMLTANSGANLLDPKSWTKHDKPVFSGDPSVGVYATGHNTFFTSPDGKEDWILYHANAGPDQGCGGKRSPRAQKFSWNADGTPNFGKPVSTQVELPKPSGTPAQ